MAERFTRVALTASVITALGLAGCSNADDQKPKGYIPRMVQINPDAVIRSGIVESDPSNADGSSGNIIDRDSLPGAITGFNNP
ncbi:MAG: hypothetical protein QG562_426, partial [Patescibacteria group bacterium]|nr:hypothetical protein [Patescibacteria group bacterium]